MPNDRGNVVRLWSADGEALETLIPRTDIEYVHVLDDIRIAIGVRRLLSIKGQASKPTHDPKTYYLGPQLGRRRC